MTHTPDRSRDSLRKVRNVYVFIFFKIRVVLSCTLFSKNIAQFIITTACGIHELEGIKPVDDDKA